ncbi:MAG: hypothetical protein GKC53_02455 [Neisseriaceae bacterium]|nr:MAG: hypothetical protein GKC53_02455 [Neisseriaceae bacterium]
MKNFVLIMVTFLFACSEKVSVDEWTELQNVLNEADIMTVGILPQKNRDEAIKIISDILVKLHALTIEDEDFKYLQNMKIQYYQTVFQLLTSQQGTEQYWQLEQKLLQLSQENYQLEQRIKQGYKPKSYSTL